VASTARTRTRRRLSRHFTVEEFDSRDGGRVRAEDYAALEHLCDWFLEPLRADFGAVEILSGFRTLAHNAAVGGAKRSVHLLRTPLPGRGTSSSTVAAAADVRCAEGAPYLWAGWARAERRESVHLARRGRGGVGLYPAFVHLDTGPARDW
jgi:uncharacterized protein YcbK (DUF882 family)